jgi:hypothetical protein
MAGNGGSGGGGGNGGTEGGIVADGTMTFFVTSRGMGDGGNLEGLAGADAFCER